MTRRCDAPGAHLVSRRWALAASAALLATPAKAAASPLKALAFDAFPIFDPRSITALARDLVPKQGEALATAWLAKLFATTWLLTAGDRYQDFASLAEASLRAVAETQHIDLPASSRDRLVGQFAHLDLWPDVKPALAKLKAAGTRLCFLSNLGEATLRANMQAAGLAEDFEAVLSTDRVQRFKPSPAAYRMAIEGLRLRKDEIGFVAFGGWDAVGATWFGYRTAWIDRLAAPPEPLAARPAVVSRGIDGALLLAGIA